jgi:hypothetical protein
MKKAKRKFLKEGSSPNVVEKDYDDGGAFDAGKMAPQPEGDSPKIKMRCGKKDGGLVKQGKPKLAKKGWR